MPRLCSLLKRLCIVALTGSLLFVAVSAKSSVLLNEQRTQYLEADRLLNQKKVNTWLKKKPRLKDYPLYHYLILKEVRATHARYSNKKIAEIATRVDVPLPGNFSRWWLNRLKNQNEWDLIVQHFGDSTNTETRCTYALAMLQSKSREEALPYVESLWLVSRSQPEQCDPVFERALKSGMIDDDLIWQRILLTAKRNQHGLTKYLKGLIRSREVRRWVDRLDLARRKPNSTISKNLSKWSQSPYGQDAIELGMTRMTSKNPDAGAKLWRTLKRKNPDAVARLARTERQIAQILGWRRHAQAYEWLAGLPESLQDIKIQRLRVRNALAKENWTGVLDSIAQMPDDEAQLIEWVYWRARALQATGKKKEANTILNSLAGERNFYGFLAADQLDIGYDLTPRGVTYPTDEFHALLEKEPGIARIREWLALRKPYSARRELTHLYDKWQGDSTFWLQTALLFHAWGWHDGTIRAAYKSGQHNDIQPSVTYPSPYINYVRLEAMRHGVPQHWIYGIMRQESLFVHDIRSGAGAVGLMQLLPSTARQVAKRIGLKRPSVNDLTSAPLNIHLGTTYFKQLLKQLNGNPIHSLVGYNAGPRRANQWQNTIRVSDPAIWVEAVPFTETRNYIKKILVNFIIYENILNSEHARIRDYLQLPHSQHASSGNE